MRRQKLRLKPYYQKWLADADIVIFGPTPDAATGGYAGFRAVGDWIREGERSGGTRRTLFRWLESGGAEAIPGQPLPPFYEIDKVFERAVLDVDYRALADIQRRFEAATRGRQVRVTSRNGTHLRVCVGDRSFTLQDGDLSAERILKGASGSRTRCRVTRRYCSDGST